MKSRTIKSILTIFCGILSSDHDELDSGTPSVTYTDTLAKFVEVPKTMQCFFFQGKRIFRLIRRERTEWAELGKNARNNDGGEKNLKEASGENDT